MLREALSLRLALALIAAACITVAISWGCAMWAPRASVNNTMTFKKPWPVAVPAEWPESANCIERHGGWGYTMENAIAVRKGDYFIAETFRAGWPFRALSSTSHREGSPTYSAATPTSASTQGMPVAASMKPADGERVLPFRPLLPGFLGDVLFFTIVTLIVFRAPRLARSFVRRLQHRCPQCGYEVAIRAGCSECGWRRAASPRPSSAGAAHSTPSSRD